MNLNPDILDKSGFKCCLAAALVLICMTYFAITNTISSVVTSSDIQYRTEVLTVTNGDDKVMVTGVMVTTDTSSVEITVNYDFTSRRVFVYKDYGWFDSKETYEEFSVGDKDGDNTVEPDETANYLATEYWRIFDDMEAEYGCSSVRGCRAEQRRAKEEEASLRAKIKERALKEMVSTLEVKLAAAKQHETELSTQLQNLQGQADTGAEQITLLTEQLAQAKGTAVYLQNGLNTIEEELGLALTPTVQPAAVDPVVTGKEDIALPLTSKDSDITIALEE
ncbi:MAG: hypothetical protein ACI8QY_000189 [bacterium]|jgi:hypothetical protein